jgi:hypothetical protein
LAWTTLFIFGLALSPFRPLALSLISSMIGLAKTKLSAFLPPLMNLPGNTSKLLSPPLLFGVFAMVIFTVQIPTIIVPN